MSTSHNEIIRVIHSLDDIYRIKELQNLLQVVVNQSEPNSIEACKTIQLMNELFLLHTFPLLQNLTTNLEILQKHYKEQI